MGFIAIGAGLCIGIAALGVGIGQGILAGNAMQGMARQPEVLNKIMTSMIVGMAIMETALVLAFVVSLMLIGKI